MKKALIFAAAALAMAGCKKGSMKPALSNDIDTISYEVGMANSMYAENYMQQAELDSTYMDEFLAGVKEGTLGAQDKKKLARYVGIMFGVQSNMQLTGLEQQLFGNDSTQHISRQNYLAGMVNGLNHKSNMALNGVPVDAQTASNDVQGRISAVRAKQFEANKKKGAEFLAQNAKQEGVKKLPGGVQYKVLAEGKGQKPTAESQTKVFYEGRLIDGTVFDSNYGQAEPMPCTPSQMIQGFGQALQQMPVGSEWEIYIPSDLAYGERDMGQIPPHSVLIFKVKLVSTEAGQAGTHRSAASIHGGATGTIDDLRDDQVAGE